MVVRWAEWNEEGLVQRQKILEKQQLEAKQIEEKLVAKSREAARLFLAPAKPVKTAFVGQVRMRSRSRRNRRASEPGRRRRTRRCGASSSRTRSCGPRNERRSIWSRNVRSPPPPAVPCGLRGVLAGIATEAQRAVERREQEREQYIESQRQRIARMMDLGAALPTRNGRALPSLTAWSVQGARRWRRRSSA